MPTSLALNLYECRLICVWVCVCVVGVCLQTTACVVRLATDAALMITNWRQTVTKNKAEKLTSTCRRFYALV